MFLKVKYKCSKIELGLLNGIKYNGCGVDVSKFSKIEYVKGLILKSKRNINIKKSECQHRGRHRPSRVGGEVVCLPTLIF